MKTDPPVGIIRWLNGPQFLGVFRSTGQCDYEGCYRGLHVCIEAKEVREARFNFRSKLKPEQYKRMAATCAAGGVAGVFVRHAPPNVKPVAYMLPFHGLRLMMKSGEKSVSMNNPVVRKPPYLLEWWRGDAVERIEEWLDNQVHESMMRMLDGDEGEDDEAMEGD